MGVCLCVNYDNKAQKNIIVNKYNIVDEKNNCENYYYKTVNQTTSNISIENPTIDYFENNFLKEINFVRTNPKEYANKLKELTKNIYKEDNTEYYYPNKNNSNEKILLKNGSKVFYNTIHYLQNLQPVNKLVWNEALKIENYDKNLIFTKENVGKIILQKRLELLKTYKNCFFNIDIFKDPILSIVFQITDDDFNQVRRNAIINKNFSKFAVNCLTDKHNNFYSICCFV